MNYFVAMLVFSTVVSTALILAFVTYFAVLIGDRWGIGPAVGFLALCAGLVAGIAFGFLAGAF